MIAAFVSVGCGKKTENTVKADKGPEPIAVRTALAEERSIEKSIMVTGSLMPDESTTVSAEVAGRVKAIYADFGQPVKKGQLLAELDPLELQLQLERTRATLAQALARLGLKPGEEAARPESTAGMRQAAAQLEDAKSKFDRAASLVKSGDVAQERFVEAQKAYQARQAAYDAMRDEMLTQLATVRGLRADVQLAEKRLRDARMYAPFDGAVTEKHVSPGQYIKENVAVLTVVKSYPLRLRVEVPESAVSQVKTGTELVFTTEAAPGAEFKATVRELNPSLDARSRTLTAEARIQASDSRLKPGSFVQVRLVTSKSFSVVTVPREAVYTIAGLNKIFSIENGKAVEHKIAEAVGTNGYVELPQGELKPGVPVAVSNVPRLVSGSPVTVTGGRN